MASMETLPFFSASITFFVAVPIDYAPAAAMVTERIVSYEILGCSMFQVVFLAYCRSRLQHHLYLPFLPHQSALPALPASV